MTRIRKLADALRSARLRFSFALLLQFFLDWAEWLRLRLVAAGAAMLVVASCAHPAEKALQGLWYGDSVENFDKEEIAAATGWARGTSFHFTGKHLEVTVPREESRIGVYQLTAIEDRNITLSVLDSSGRSSELELIMDDAKSLRWVLDEGRTLVMKRED